MGCKTLSFCPKNRILFVSRETFAKKRLKFKKSAANKWFYSFANALRLNFWLLCRFAWNKMSNYTQVWVVLHEPIYKIMKIVCQRTMFHVKQKMPSFFDVFDFFCLRISLKTGKIQGYKMNFDSFLYFMR